MSYNISISKKEDLESFEEIFIKNIGDQQTVYDVYLGDVMVRVQVHELEKSQRISIGFFEISKSKNNINLRQFPPMSDNRFKGFEIIKEIWRGSPYKEWAVLYFTSKNTIDSFETIYELLRTVYKFNNLKAFL